MDIKDILKKAIEDPESILGLNHEDTANMASSIKPFQIPETDESYISLSVTNVREEYMKRFLTTSMIGYLFRLAKEYDLNKHLTKDEKITVIEMDFKRAAVMEFLNYTFEFNPDRHVLQAHKENKADPERERIDAAIDKMSIKKPKKLEKVFDDPAEAAKKLVMTCNQHITQLTKLTNGVVKLLRQLGAHEDGNNPLDDYVGIFMKKYAELKKMETYMKGPIQSFSKYDTKEALLHLPSQDVFHYFTRYISSNYEELRFATEALYMEKPDIEFSVTYYDWHNTLKDAEEFQIKHQKEFTNEVFTISNKGVTLIGPFKENMDRIKFYNKNAEIINSMLEKNKEDLKIGEELTKKRIVREKTKNIKEAGPDNPAIEGYNATVGNLSKINKPFTDEDKKKAIELYKEKQSNLKKVEEEEIQKDALEVVVYSSEIDDEGKQLFNKGSFLTQAETKKEFVERNS